MMLRPGDIVVDGAGDRGVVRKIGQPRTFGADALLALVEWETLDGVPVFMQASWEDVGDLVPVAAIQ